MEMFKTIITYIKDKVLAFGTFLSDLSPIGVLIAALLIAVFTWVLATCAANAKAPGESTVMVVTAGGQGSGVFIGEDRILTANHVVSAGKAYVELPNGIRIPASVTWTSKDEDLTLLTVVKSPVLDLYKNPAFLACGYRTHIGEVVIAEGFPINLGLVVSSGQVLNQPLDWNDWDHALAVDNALGPGMSGGPVYNAEGRVIGLVVAGTQFGINVATLSEAVCEHLDLE